MFIAAASYGIYKYLLWVIIVFDMGSILVSIFYGGEVFADYRQGRRDFVVDKQDEICYCKRGSKKI